ncbi:MAG TPA: hypothetical protein VGT00_00930 [Methylomirabilota bacterium]|nr:hypothetical protein [Methylomirabilota bacterium]
MSELQQYYDAFRTGYWAVSNAEECPCRGSGWALSEVDTFHKCPIHFDGQRSPEEAEFDDGEDVAAAPFPAPAVVVPAPVASLPVSDDEIPF